MEAEMVRFPATEDREVFHDAGSNARNASASIDSPSAVEPTTSQNTTVTVFRNSRLDERCGEGALPKPQN
jgi:hypothetical protein